MVIELSQSEKQELEELLASQVGEHIVWNDEMKEFLIRMIDKFKVLETRGEKTIHFTHLAAILQLKALKSDTYLRGESLQRKFNSLRSEIAVASQLPVPKSNFIAIGQNLLDKEKLYLAGNPSQKDLHTAKQAQLREVQAGILSQRPAKPKQPTYGYNKTDSSKHLVNYAEGQKSSSSSSTSAKVIAEDDLPGLSGSKRSRDSDNEEDFASDDNARLNVKTEHRKRKPIDMIELIDDDEDKVSYQRT